MTNSNILYRLRRSLHLSEPQLVRIFAAGGSEVAVERLDRLFSGMAKACSDEELRCFLSGLITLNRGPSTNAPPPPEKLTNNEVLKKLRVAFNLKEADLRAIFLEQKMSMNKGTLSALFRSPTHSKFRTCTDEQITAFISGLRSQKVLFPSDSEEE